MRKNTRYYKKLFFISILFVMVLGYALISSNLDIVGTLNLKHANWNIHWDSNSVEVAEGSISSELPIVNSDEDEVSYTINLSNPGDFFEFTLDAVNDGDVDGMVGIDSLDPVITDGDGEEIELPDYLKYKVTYSDDKEIERYHYLKAGEIETIKVRIEFDKEVEKEDLPSEAIQLNITTNLPYRQADDNAYERDKSKSEATFDTGKAVNVKFKTLAGNTVPETDPWTINDTNIISFERSNTAPDISLMTDDNIVSSQDSIKPIYAWFDNGTIYWWSEANTSYFNEDSSYFFNNFRNITNINIDSINSSNTKNMSNMFARIATTTIDFSKFNTSNATDMSMMFAGTLLENLNLSGFDVSKVTNFGSVFGGCSSLKTLDISNWDFASVTSLSNFFNTSLINLESINMKNINTSNIDNMNSMFQNLPKLASIDLSDFDTENVTNMYLMFCGCSSLKEIDVSSFDTSKVTSMGVMFNGCSSLKKIDLSMLSTDSLTGVGGIFYNCTSLEEINLSNWDFSKLDLVTRNGFFAYYLANGYQSLKKVVLDSAILPRDMVYGFAELSTLEEISLNDVDTSHTTDMSYMFYEDDKLTEINLSSFNTKNVTTMDHMFFACSGLESLDVSSFDTGNVTDMNSMFAWCDKLTTLDLSGFDIKKVTYLGNLIGGCSSLEEINLSNWEFVSTDLKFSFVIGAGNVNSLKKIIMDNAVFYPDLTYAFGGLKTVEEISLKNVDTTKVTNMSSLFSESTNIKVLDLKYFDTSNVTNMATMFNKCDNLTTIYAGDNFVTTNVTNSGYMFNESPKIVGGAGTLWNSEHIDKEYAHVDGGTSNPGYFTMKKDITIRFNPNEGTVSRPIKELNNGEAIGELPEAQRYGYRFLGWYTGLTDGTKITSSYVPSENQTLYAHWEALDKYTITFNPNGGSVDEGSREIYEGEKLGELPIPTKENCEFIGWYTEATGGEEVNENTIPSGNDIYYAHWIEHIKYRVTLNPNEGSVSPTFIDVDEGEEVGELPTPTRTDYTFDGWHIDVTDYIDIDSSYIPTADITLYAKWYPTGKVAEINGTFYNTLQTAVSAVPTTDVETTVRLLTDVSETITINSGRNVVLNLQNYTLSNNGVNNVIKNNAKLKLYNGTITTDTTQGAINNNSGATLVVSGGRIIATGTRQGIYNDGGTLTITGDAYISSAATERSAVHNKNSGKVTIIGGTIVSSNLYAIYNENGTLTIGEKDGIIDTTTPVIQGKTYGIAANNTYKFYDGIIKGGTYHVGKTSNTGNTPVVTDDTNETKITEIEDDSEKLLGTETIGSTTYKTLKLQEMYQKYKITFNPNGGEVNPTEKKIIQGNQVGELPTPTRGGYEFLGWYTLPQDGVQVTSTTIPSGNVTYYAHWSELTATFDTGITVNGKFKKLAGNSSTSYLTIDNNVTSIQKSNLEPTAENKTSEHIVSASNSELPIYAWFDNGTIYWWCNTDDVYLNKFSSELFKGYNSLLSLNLSQYNTSIVKSMDDMFEDCSNLTSLDLGDKFDTSNVTNMRAMFYSCSSLTSLDLGDKFDTSNVTDMIIMFRDCSSLTSLDLGDKFDTSNVTDMSLMFYSCSSLTSLDLGDKFNTISVTSMGSMFSSCSSLTSLDLGDKFDTSSVTSMGSMFEDCTNLTSLDLGDKFDTNQVANMYSMFSSCSSLTSLDLGDKFDTSNVKSMNSMFSICNSLTSLDLGDKFDTSNVKSMNSMFQTCSNLTSLDLGDKFDTSSVTDMSAMFRNCSNLTSLDLGDKFDTSSVTDMRIMFSSCSGLTNLDLGDKFDTNQVTNMFSMFENCTNLTGLNLGDKFDTNSVTNMSYMFKNCSNLTHLDLGDKFDIGNVKSTSSMFYNCNNLTSLNIGNKFDTSNVIVMNSMFYNCSKLTNLDLGYKFDTSNVTNMSSMFQKCSNLTTIYVSPLFVVTSVTSSSDMFTGDTKLVGGNGTVYNSRYKDKTYARIDTAATPGYFTLKDGWVLMNRGSIGNPATHLLDQQWSYYENGERKETGFYMLDDLYGVQQKYYFVNGIAQLGWLHYDGDYYYLSTEDDDGNGYVNAGAYRSETKVIDGVSYDFDSDGKCTNYNGTAFNTVGLNANGGEVSPNIINVNTNSTIGTLPTPTRAGYTFLGWYTGITDGVQVDSTYVPTSDITLFARWRSSRTANVDFETSSFRDIIDAYKSGDVANLRQAMQNGDTRPILLDLNNDGVPETGANLRIANLSTPAECENQGFSQSACGLVLEFADIITEHRMNLYNVTGQIGDGNYGGWEYSEMRNYLNSTVYNELPQELKSRIVDTPVVSSHGSNDSTNFTTTDKIYLFSTKEVYGKEGTTKIINYDSAEIETRQLDYYKEKEVTTDNCSGAKKKKLDGTPYYWWLRSANSDNDYAFYEVHNYGSWYDNHPSDKRNGVSPAFRIG